MSSAKSVCAAVAAGLIGTSWAVANHDERFKQLDTNQDGRLSLVEFADGKVGDAKAKAEADFKKYDEDKSGALSLGEYKKAYDAAKKEEDKERKPGEELS